MKGAIILLILGLAFAAQAKNLAFVRFSKLFVIKIHNFKLLQEKAKQDDCLACAGDIITAVENCNVR